VSNCYLFVVNGERDSMSGHRSPARDVLQRRLADGRWPLNARTPHQRDLAAGDEIVFYVAGADPEQSCFVGTGVVTGSRVQSDRTGSNVPSWIGLAESKLFDVPVRLGAFFADPLQAAPLISSLGFVKNKERWGTYFQGGVRRIPRDDFEQIIRAAKPSEAAS
jgi:hypothetical protein